MSPAEPTVLITGAGTTSIGGYLALEFRKLGWRVYATSRKTSNLTPLTYHGIETLELDVTDPSSILKCKEELDRRMARAPRLDVLINNAGVTEYGPAIETPIDGARNVMETNVLGVMAVTQTFVPWLIRSKGKAVFLGSPAASQPLCFQAAYSASKAALHQYVRILRLELAPFDVRVVNLVTGLVATRLQRNGFGFDEGSLWRSMSDEHTRFANQMLNRCMGAERYARSVVPQIVSENPRNEIYEGNLSWLAYWVAIFVPAFIVDWAYAWAMGLWKFERGLRARNLKQRSGSEGAVGARDRKQK